jgi:hypothetical protein
VVQSSGLQSQATTSSKKATASYLAFNGRSYELAEHRGHYVSVLVPDSVSEGPVFRPDHIEELVDRLDLLYIAYREILHTEPSGPGLLGVAFVPETCGSGCGLIGHKGIEIRTDSWLLEGIVEELDAGRLDALLVHEMAHNFDTFADYLHYLPDHAHAWTDMFEYFGPYRFDRNIRGGQAPDEIYDSPARSIWKNYIADPEANWAACVRDQACGDRGLSANHLWAMLYYRIEAIYGAEALLDSFEFIADHASRNPVPDTIVGKESLRILSLAVGAGVNVTCYVDSLDWPLADEVRSEMRQRFGDGGEFCIDADRDGFSRINGDCDDHDPSSNISSLEIRGNGRDDDCDELMDENSLVEQGADRGADGFDATVNVSLPFEVSGSASDLNDADSFAFSLGGSGRVRVTLCTQDRFTGWATALRPDGSFLESDNWYAYLPAAGCSSTTIDYGSLTSGGIKVIPDESGGSYELTVSQAGDLPSDHSIYLEIRSRPLGGVTLHVDDRDGYFDSLGADEIEFWLSGAAVRVLMPFRGQTTLELPPSAFPSLADGGIYQARIRPRAQGLPLTNFSDGHLFRYERAPSVTSIDSGFSGAWYDPEHDGEGFIVEVLEDQRALVYWFSYQDDGRQRWLLGVGTIEGNRLQVRELSDSSGGRFGKDFDPDEVELQRRGSLSMAFYGCSEAVANYSIEGTGGQQRLKRLTDVHGHGCGRYEALSGPDLSGSWFDPRHEGEGFVLQRTGEQDAVVFWFSYDDQGNQAWMFSSGEMSGSRISFVDLKRPVGGQFGRSFDPATVSREPWGELELELNCDGGEARYTTGSRGFSNGIQKLVALTRLGNSGCAE